MAEELKVIKRCAACRNEKPVSEMKVCMHAQMHNYVCDSKCMNDFYNPPKKPAKLPSQGGEAVEVVGYANPAEYGMYRFWVCSTQRAHITDPLMAVAQHQRILAAITHPADQVDGVVVSRELAEYLADFAPGHPRFDELRTLLDKSEGVKK